jgi:hypothetical protein
MTQQELYSIFNKRVDDLFYELARHINGQGAMFVKAKAEQHYVKTDDDTGSSYYQLTVDFWTHPMPTKDGARAGVEPTLDTILRYVVELGRPEVTLHREENKQSARFRLSLQAGDLCVYYRDAEESMSFTRWVEKAINDHLYVLYMERKTLVTHITLGGKVQ